MRIVHIGLVGPFNEDMSYQGNLLPIENKKAGHDVTIITTCLKWEQNKIMLLPEEDRITENGIRLIRLRYKKYINYVFSEKIRKVEKLFFLLEKLHPDVILLHDIQTMELFTLCSFKKKYPHVKIFADSHTDHNNSANNWFSLNFLHGVFYKWIIRHTFYCLERILYVSYETEDFLKDVYEIPSSILEFFPLGGIVISKESKAVYRKEIRENLNLSETNLIFTHSGKMDIKKKTIELIQSFLKSSNPNFRLLLIGQFDSSIEGKVYELLKVDDRIIFLGWKNSDDLLKIIAASDLYLQPGSQSATMQNALCLGTPVLFANVKSHRVYMKGNAFAIDNESQIINIFDNISNNPNILHDMSDKAFKLATELLDYSKLAKRITE